MSIYSTGIKYARFAMGLRKFAHNTTNLDQAKKVIADRLVNREKNFLNLVEKGVYQYPASPYLPLLKSVGCEYEDIALMVNKDGIEASLQKLLKAGVYISWEEFKGKQDKIVDGRHIHYTDNDFDNPLLPIFYQFQSSGSRSAGTRTTLDLDFRSEMGHYRIIEMVANNAFGYPVVSWRPVPPSASGLNTMLSYWQIGNPLKKWFSPVDEKQVQASFKHRMALRYIVYCGRLWGAKLVYPEKISLQDAVKVARWVETAKKEHGSASIDCFISLAVMVADAATKHNLDIKGTTFFSGGEPLTDTKCKIIEAAGAKISSRYVISEIGRIGMGCPLHSFLDDVHFMHDMAAVIQHPRVVPFTDMTVNSFLFTSLLPVSPKLLINVGFDDFGEIEKRDCDCLYGQLGFHTHIHNIRSFSKLTGQGMTIMGSDLVKTLEETLPVKFGGTPTDYQLIEEEDEKGQTHLNLIISPAVGNIDESQVIETILSDLRKNAYGGKLAAGLWSQLGILKIKRMYPLSKGGKILTLHLQKRDNDKGK
jgi:hypothetical protein